jgi:transcriptional regulator with XRE-family HTH domain
VDPSASSAARLGAEIRALRQRRGLTLEQLADRIGFSASHLSAVELAESSASEQFVRACDAALDGGGALVALLPAAVYERATERRRNAARRRWRGERQMSQPDAPEPASGLVTVEPRAALDLSPDAPLATLTRKRCPGVRLAGPSPDLGSDWTLMLPRSAATAVQIHAATGGEDSGRVLVTVRDTSRLEQFLRVPHRAMLLAVEHDASMPRSYGLDASAVRSQLAERPRPGAVISIPRAYELDDLTYGLLWAASNLDDCLLADDATLAKNNRKLSTYERLSRSEVTREVTGDLSGVSQAWLGSSFCARHILRNFGRLGDLPLFWTREQRGEEACTWLLFAHKLAYLRAARRYLGSTTITRAFCVPEHVVRDSPLFERVLLFLAIALMEAHGVEVKICTEQEYSDVDGFVLAPARRAIVATWVRADSIWHVDTTERRGTLAEFGEAVGHAAAHSAIASPTASGRLAALADYLELNLAWLRRRCAQLAREGCGGLIRPRSRLLAVVGVDAACASAAGATGSR